MPKDKPAQNHERLVCNLPPKEALRRAMMVKPPKDWKKAVRSTRKPRP